jgi:hypothetical protein
LRDSLLDRGERRLYPGRTHWGVGFRTRIAAREPSASDHRFPLVRKSSTLKLPAQSFIRSVRTLFVRFTSPHSTHLNHSAKKVIHSFSNLEDGRGGKSLTRLFVVIGLLACNSNVARRNRTPPSRSYYGRQPGPISPRSSPLSFSVPTYCLSWAAAGNNRYTEGKATTGKQHVRMKPKSKSIEPLTSSSKPATAQFGQV